MSLKTLGKFSPKALLVLLAAPAVAAVALINGPTWGDWDLPNGASNGWAKGVLQDTSGNTIFKMKAKLVEFPSPALSIRNGKLKGVLDDGSGLPWPRYTVSGSWSGNAFTGEGTFNAIISRQVSPMGPVALVGKMAGKYSDPGWWWPIGKYKGEWKANL